jgi:hypothetical protein
MSAAVAKTGITMAGKKLGDFLVRQGIKVGGKAGGYAVKEAGRVAAEVGKKAAVEAALGMAVEQGLPRAMGTEPTSSFAESAVRQASSGLISQGLQVGAARRFPQAAASNMGTRILPTAGFIAGQVGGKRITDAAFGAPKEFVPVQDTPTGATIASQEPESVDIIKPTTRDLSGIQAQEALSEREKYEYQMKIAQIKNQPTHTYMHYQTEPTPLDVGAYGQARMKSAYSGDFS